jgi:hypothetical protein
MSTAPNPDIHSEDEERNGMETRSGISWTSQTEPAPRR